MFNTRRVFVGQNKNIFLSRNRFDDVISYPISKNNKHSYNYFVFAEENKTSYILYHKYDFVYILYSQ